MEGDEMFEKDLCDVPESSRKNITVERAACVKKISGRLRVRILFRPTDAGVRFACRTVGVNTGMARTNRGGEGTTIVGKGRADGLAAWSLRTTCVAAADSPWVAVLYG